ncbi:hypothetical protein AB1046_09270 [Promicromonospora sp. Populi]|uniref:hypothetical protein n=1 Tax=Promicromonospora sp. Populi TaxID=3239420 RepID=UPI0034E279A9
METEAASSVPWELVGTALTSLLGVIGLWLGRTGRSHVRDEVEQDQRILANLPEHSSMRATLQKSIDARVRQIAGSVDKASEARRNPFGVGLAMFFLILATSFGWWAMASTWVLWAPAAFFGFVGLIGLYRDGRKVPRDAAGNEIEKPST